MDNVKLNFMFAYQDWGVVKGTFGTFCLSSQIFGKCQTFCGAKSAKSAKLLKKVNQFYVQ